MEEHLFLYKGDYELSEQIEVIWEENEKRKNSEKINDIIHIMSKNNSIKIKKEIKWVEKLRKKNWWKKKSICIKNKK